jgi:hypothetical protein
MSFSFRFTGTHQDLLDAYAAQQRSRSGMCPWVRACVIGLGFMWLAGTVAFAPQAFREGHAWQPIVWFFLGSIIIWKFLVQPILVKRRIRTATPSAQSLALDVTDSGIRVEADGVRVLDRIWAQFDGIEPAEDGVVIRFTNGMIYRLPNRVFRADDQRQAFISYVISQLPEKERVREMMSSLGCLLTLIGICVSGYLALTLHWTYATVGAALICGALLLGQIRLRRERRRLRDVLNAVFAPSGRPVPLLKEGSSYGFPTFTLTFPSEAELRQAEQSGCLAAFKQAIQSLYRHAGCKQMPFDANCAVSATYEGRKHPII